MPSGSSVMPFGDLCLLFASVSTHFAFNWQHLISPSSCLVEEQNDRASEVLGNLQYSGCASPRRHLEMYGESVAHYGAWKGLLALWEDTKTVRQNPR